MRLPLARALARAVPPPRLLPGGGSVPDAPTSRVRQRKARGSSRAASGEPATPGNCLTASLTTARWSTATRSTAVPVAEGEALGQLEPRCDCSSDQSFLITLD